MSVQRFRDVADMPPLPRGDPNDPSTYARIRELWRFSARHLTPLFPPGVCRFRSIEEMSEARETAEMIRMRAIAENRS